MITLENGRVYRTDGALKYLLGDESYVQTERINSQTVVDISLRFDLTSGVYEEIGRVERTDILPPTPEEEREQRLVDVELMLAELMFGQL